MTKRLILSLLLILVVQLMFGTITMTYNFEKPSLDENGDYTKITLEDCFTNGIPAQPEIPYKGALIYLPQNEEITGINIRLSNPQEILVNNKIYPAQQQYPLSLREMLNLLSQMRIYICQQKLFLMSQARISKLILWLVIVLVALLFLQSSIILLKIELFGMPKQL